MLARGAWHVEDVFGRRWRIWIGGHRAEPDAMHADDAEWVVRRLVASALTAPSIPTTASSVFSARLAPPSALTASRRWTGYTRVRTNAECSPRSSPQLLVQVARIGRLQISAAPQVHVPPPEERKAPEPPVIADAPVDERASTWFELTVLDEVGTPIEGLEIVFRIDGKRRVVSTDGSGVARVDDVFQSFTTAAPRSAEAVREKMKPRWTEPRTPKRFEDPSIEVRELDDDITATLSLESEKPFTLVIAPYFRCHEIPGAHFTFGRSFVRSDALTGLAAIAEDLLDDDGCKAMIFGHTDLAGDERVNKELSERRARALHALFTHDHAAWMQLWSGKGDGKHWREKWRLDEAQHMLNALGVTDDAGRKLPEHGKRDASTKQGIHRFQAGDYPDKPAEQAPLARSDYLGDDGLRELFLAYAKRITRKPIPASSFADIGGSAFMGCGEFNPLSVAAKDLESRRAVVFVFDTAAGPTNLPCKLRDLGPCKASCGPPAKKAEPGTPPYRCDVYRLVATKCPCQGGPEIGHDLVVRLPFPLASINAFGHVLVMESDDGTITRTRTLRDDARALDEEECEVYFTDLPPMHQYRLRAEAVSEPYEVFSFTPFEELSTLSAKLTADDEQRLVDAAIATAPQDFSEGTKP